MTAFSFILDKQSGKARTGLIMTAHGAIKTPAFMPVGTAGTVKGMLPEQVRATGADILLGNTYHLMLRPTAEIVAKLGGLHKFMQWDGPILTDSGGFQVMSLAKLRTITEKGVTFQSHLDGNSYELTPERSIEIQRLLGSDIAMAFDECTPHPATERQTADSMRLSMRWAERSKQAFTRPPPTPPAPLYTPPACGGSRRGECGGSVEGGALFGIVQGGMYNALREESANALRAIGFEGYAIGGLAVGEGQETMFGVLDFTAPLLPEGAPRYLMGVGKPEDIIGAVLRGVDMFDCVIPTRAGRFGRAYTSAGEINIKNACHSEDAAPLDMQCACPCCSRFSRAYLHHLFRADEMLGPLLLTWHNLFFYQKLMSDIRQAIEKGSLREFEAAYVKNTRKT